MRMLTLTLMPTPTLTHTLTNWRCQPAAFLTGGGVRSSRAALSQRTRILRWTEAPLEREGKCVKHGEPAVRYVHSTGLLDSAGYLARGI
eukprot:6184965-Pleurochrysis_carterae.AAC.2